MALSKHLLSQEDKIPTATYPGIKWNCILASEAGFDSGKLEGEGLTIGGKGFKDIYDRLLPKSVGRYVKTMGGKVGVGNLASTTAKNP